MMGRGGNCHLGPRWTEKEMLGYMQSEEEPGTEMLHLGMGWIPEDHRLPLPLSYPT